ncbi:allantoate amidohydrolase [Ruminiclostridium hungatei]|uniref:Allantoate amidohydrolase n=1 Tax=Ruminiclostridium hungatei TaxID=48256 RepID=A0A1V4SI94_RUMHU|nr:Zn-dependent hydrolase [Ruminiclostridium hungatei]OPX43622.1 allantoate amidohydrolase [Ruminiclostridium hungatei]
MTESFNSTECLGSVLRHLEFLKNMDNGWNHRLLYTDAWNMAMDELESWMLSGNMKTRRDALGNLYGRIEGRSDKTVLLLSHYDSVESGGSYDGALGVIAGLAVLDTLFLKYGTPEHNIELLAVCDEDGGRFKSSFLGSRAITGEISYEEIEGLTDAAGLSFNAARERAGLAPIDEEILKSCKRSDILCAFELHAEQGRKLYDSGIPAGIVKTITGQYKIKAEFTGEANHAGTTTMQDRQDALVAAAELVGFVQQLARQSGCDSVGTVGVLEVRPGATNIIPDKAMLIADLRCPQSEVLLNMGCSFEKKCNELALKNGLRMHIEYLCRQMPVPMDECLTGLSREIAEELNIPYLDMFSGAGHDIQIISSIAPGAMIFVQSERGISHSPEEYTDAASIKIGMDILGEAVYRTAYKTCSQVSHSI